MALNTCPDCQHHVSDLAHACPGCGRPRNGQPAHLSRTSADRSDRVEWQLNQIRNAVTFIAVVAGIALLVSCSCFLTQVRYRVPQNHPTHLEPGGTMTATPRTTINHDDWPGIAAIGDHHVDGLIATVEQARDNKRHATALVGAIVACHANLDGTDNWPGIAAIGEHWLSDAWARLAERAGTPNPSMAVRSQTLAILAQIGTDGAPTASEIWDAHITRNHGYDVAAAIVTDQHRYGHNDWRHLAHWLDTNWGDQQWADLAKVHRIRCHLTVPVQQAAINVLCGIDCHNQPTVDQLLAHDAERRSSKRATANLVPVVA